VDGPLRSINGYAVRTEEPGKLQVFFPNSDSPGSYWIVALGPVVDRQYQWAVVSDNRQVTLFVLARDPTTFKDVYEAQALERIGELGFTTFFNRPLPVQQEGCPAQR
jgi:lipocalin